MDTFSIIKIILFQYENHAQGKNHINEYRFPNFTHCLPRTCLPWFMYVSKKSCWLSLMLIHSFREAVEMYFMYTTCFKHCRPQPFHINSRFCKPWKIYCYMVLISLLIRYISYCFQIIHINARNWQTFILILEATLLKTFSKTTSFRVCLTIELILWFKNWNMDSGWIGKTVSLDCGGLGFFQVSYNYEE